MQAADESLSQVYERYLAALHDRDVPTILEMSVDDPEGSFMGFAAPPGEEKTLAEWREVLGTFPHINIVDSDAHGFVEGDFAWFYGIVLSALPGNPKPERLRVTMVLRRVDGKWKVVHFHVSQTVANPWF